MKVIISAAGTGGHINPGIAIANKIKEKEHLYLETNKVDTANSGNTKFLIC